MIIGEKILERILLIYFILLITAIAISLKTKKRIGITTFLSIVSISIIQYLLGVIGLLKIGNIVTICFSLFFIFYIINHFIKNKNLSEFVKENWLDFIVFTFLYIITFIILYERSVITHNELSHWALMTKDMVYHDTFPKAGNNLLYAGYPPMLRTWYYWFANFFEVFKDGQIYVANALIHVYISIATVSLFNIKSKIKDLFLKILTISLTIITSTMFYVSLFADIVLALLFVFLIVYIYKIKKITVIDFIILSATLVFLELTKEIGMLFIIVVFIYLFMLQKKYYSENIKKLLLIIFVMFLVICTFKNSWTLYLELNNLNQAWDTSGFSKENIINFVTGNGKEYQYSTLKNYMKQLGIANNFRLFKTNIPILYIVIFSIIAILIMMYIKKDNKDEIKKVLISLLLFDFIFLFGLLCMYLFSFAEWEARILSAFTRYIQIVTVINLLLVLFLYVENFKKTLIPIILLIVVINFGNNRTITTFTEYKEKNEEYKNIASEYSDIQQHRDILNENDKIYVITEFDNPITREYVLLNLRYQMVPYDVFMLDEENVTEEELIEKLQCDYTYVYVYNCRRWSVGKYESLFASEDYKLKYNALFKIVYNDNKLTLEEVK